MNHPFASLGLIEPLVRAVSEMNYSEPTPVQKKAMPFVLAGRDVLAAAQTGTGKTAAYSLPIIQKIAATARPLEAGEVRALILAPTRELAAQIHENIQAYTKYLDIRSALVFGGVNIRPQITALKKGVDILVATPGRLLDHVGQKTVSLGSVEFFVLDEADRMLDMGFIHDIRKVLKLIPEARQSLLFSATFSSEIRKLADSLLKEPASVEISPNKESALIHQKAYAIPKNRKRELLRDLIVDGQWDQVLVFTRMKHAANRLCQQLIRDGIEAAAIHGNKSQNARTKALADFKAKNIRVLVATDIAARGLDIEQLPHVVNYDLPDVSEDYVHRIGRTGRAGTPGHAVSLVSPDDRPLLAAIERLIRNKIELVTPEGYDGPQPEDLAAEEKQAEQEHRRMLSRQTEARRAAKSRRRAERVEAKAAEAARPAPVSEAVAEAVSGSDTQASDAAPAEDPASDRDRSAPARRGETRRRQTGRAASRKTGGTQGRSSRSDRAERSERSDRTDRAERPSRFERTDRFERSDRFERGGRSGRAERFDPDNFGNSIHYQPKRGSRRQERDGDSIARYEPVDPFAPEHQALFLPQSQPGERPYRAGSSRPQQNRGGRRAPEGEFRGRRSGPGRPRSARSTDFFEQNSRYSDSTTHSNLPPGLITRRSRGRNR